MGAMERGLHAPSLRDRAVVATGLPVITSHGGMLRWLEFGRAGLALPNGQCRLLWGRRKDSEVLAKGLNIFMGWAYSLSSSAHASSA
eukprot:scaffold124669_cov35-Tisochrysis_lutea.AAC.1